MNIKECKVVVVVSALVSLALLCIGIFIRAAIELPLHGMSYGFVFDLFKNPDFFNFHVKAYIWFFVASSISSAVVLKYAKS